MSNFVKHQATTPKTVKFALLIGIVWAVILGVVWFAYRGDEDQSGGFINFVGRFHVLIVHFPIGVIALAALMEVLSHFTAFSHLSRSLPFVLWLSFLGSVGATVVGYFLMSAEGIAGRAMSLHLYFGLAVVVFILIALIMCLIEKRLFSALATFAATFAMFASGHFGGAMIHEADYLTEYAPAALKPALSIGLVGHEEPGAGEKDHATPAEIPMGERLVYEDFVVPILDKTCNECHNENKIKGKLRMDTHELLLAGAEGSDFPTVVPGNSGESEMIVRVNLPADDDEVMPPKGDPLQPSEVKLLSLWIDSGAGTETTVAQLGEDPSIIATATEVAAIHSEGKEDGESALAAETSLWDTLTSEEKAQRLADVADAAEKHHFSVMPISAEDDHLRVNVINAAKEFGDEQLKLLEPVADHVVWLDLARSQVTDAGMKTVRLMRGLERLHLENTAVTGTGIAELANLSELEYLNLYGTKVGNEIFETFASMPGLKKVFLWQTGVDPAEAKSFERSVNLEINTGVDLAAVTPVEAPVEAPAEAPKEEAAKPEAKKEEPKPAAKKVEPAKTAKPAETKPAETKPAEKKDTPAKPADSKPAAAEVKPIAAESKPAEKKETPAKPAETKPVAPATAEKKAL